MSDHFRMFLCRGLCQMSDDAAAMGRLLYESYICPPSRFFALCLVRAWDYCLSLLDTYLT